MVTNDYCLELILYLLEVLCGTLHYTGGHRLEFYKSAQWLVLILENYVKTSIYPRDYTFV